MSYTYRLSIGMRTIQKNKGSRKKTKYFCGKRSRNGDYRQTAKAVDEKQSLRRRSELYLFKKGGKNDFYGGDELRRI